MKVNRLALLMVAGYVILFLNLFWMQVLRGDYYRSLSEKNRIRTLYLEAPRGNVLDRNGAPLAVSRLSFNCSVIPREAKWTIAKSCRVIAPILGVSTEELEKRFAKRKPGLFNTVILAEDIPRAQAMAIEEKIDMLPGFLIETRPQREYPFSEATAHLLGYTGPLTDKEDEKIDLYDYRRSDWVGRDGLEKAYESYLRGYSGGLQIEVDSRGRFVRALGVQEPKEGKNVMLTIDGKLQEFVQQQLRPHKGAVLVMELEEGGLLAMNSAPSFDSNLFSSSKGRKEVGRYFKNENAPMMNRGIRGQYPPGSIFKIVTALAALEERKISPSTSFNCIGSLVVGGNRFHCWKEGGHGPQAMTEAFAHSCNVFFYSAGLLAGVEAIHEKAVEFGMSKATGIDLPGENSGFVPSRSWKKKKRKEAWYDGETANLTIGQGYLQVTPAQALVMISAVATDGQVLRPHVIRKIEDLNVAERHSKSMPGASSEWRAVKEGLDQAINSDTGTGRLSRHANFRIAGKTGTAQSGQGKTHAWYVGFAPLENPKIAMVVFLEHGGRGGVSAAGIAGSVFKWLKEAKYL